MALYAFDGTWNDEHDAGEYGKDTNVVRFHHAYDGKNHFYKGVGANTAAWVSCSEAPLVPAGRTGSDGPGVTSSRISQLATR